MSIQAAWGATEKQSQGGKAWLTHRKYEHVILCDVYIRNFQWIHVETIYLIPPALISTSVAEIFSETMKVLVSTTLTELPIFFNGAWIIGK